MAQGTNSSSCFIFDNVDQKFCNKMVLNLN